jgi:hypothetical protein
MAESAQLSVVNVQAMQRPSSAHARAHDAAVCEAMVRNALPVAKAGVAAAQMRPNARDVKMPRMRRTVQ